MNEVCETQMLSAANAASTNELRYLLRLVREYGDAFGLSRIVFAARAAAYAETTGPYRPGVTENMIMLDAALSCTEAAAPIERVRAAYQAAVATCYATQCAVSPALVNAMSRIEYAAITRDTTCLAVFDVLDRIDVLLAAIEPIDAPTEAAEAETTETTETTQAPTDAPIEATIEADALIEAPTEAPTEATIAAVAGCTSDDDAIV